jgi:hypothetical protein
MAPAVLTVAVTHEHRRLQRSVSNVFAQATTLKDEIGTHKVISLSPSTSANPQSSGGVVRGCRMLTSSENIMQRCCRRESAPGHFRSSIESVENARF